MKNSKIIFAIITGVVIIACIVCFLLFEDTPTTISSIEGTELIDTTFPTTVSDDPNITIPEITQQEPINTTQEAPPVALDSNVTINQVEKAADEVIDRMPTTDPNHPEVLDIEQTSPMMSAEGSVYRNDKEISIEILDANTGDIFNFTFGHITGQCNRFLYLNPKFTCNGEPVENNIYFHFSPAYGGGTVTTCGIDPQENIDNELLLNYSFYRALEERQVAGYADAKHPGTIWFTQSPIDNNIYIDVTAHYYQSGLIATMRLTISKGEDGTYFIVDLDNNDLLQNGKNQTYSQTELAYIVETANTIFHTPGAIHSYNSLYEDWNMTVTDCLIEVRTPETGLYYNQFIPADGSEWTREYAQSQMPILAVNFKIDPTHTMYLMVIQEPTETTHGIYQFIGYDYPLYQTVALLQGYLYQGQG